MLHLPLSEGNPNQHFHYDTPLVLLGGGIKGNRHISYPSRTVTTSDALLAVLRLFNINEGDTLHDNVKFDGKTFGESTGKETEII